MKTATTKRVQAKPPKAKAPAGAKKATVAQLDEARAKRIAKETGKPDAGEGWKAEVPYNAEAARAAAPPVAPAPQPPQKREANTENFAFRVGTGLEKAVKEAAKGDGVPTASFGRAALMAFLELEPEARRAAFARLHPSGSAPKKLVVERFKNRVIGTTAHMQDMLHRDFVVDPVLLQEGSRWAVFCEDHGKAKGYADKAAASEAVRKPWKACQGCLDALTVDAKN